MLFIIKKAWVIYTAHVIGWNFKKSMANCILCFKIFINRLYSTFNIAVFIIWSDLPQCPTSGAFIAFIGININRVITLCSAIEWIGSLFKDWVEKQHIKYFYFAAVCDWWLKTKNWCCLNENSVHSTNFGWTWGSM